MLVPEIVSSLRDYSRAQAIADVTAGVIVGIVALPLCIAFAIASGLPPAYGLYTGVVAGFLISAFGGSRVQIGGPTGAFVVIVYGIVQEYGVAGLTVATIMAGAILVAMGLARMGGAIKFIPFPVTTGFTSGIALVIFSSQIPDLLGLRLAKVPVEFFAKWNAIARGLGTINPHATLLAAGALVILIGWPKLSRRVPAPFVALLAATIATWMFGLQVETIGTRFGEISGALPRMRIPNIGFDTMRHLAAPAFTIAILAAIESLLSAVVADGMIGTKHKSNAELVAQGIANVVAPIFGGMPATGAIARTATNINNGGRTPVAGMVHAITLLLITLFFGRWVAYIPLAALAAILVMVAYHMSGWRTFRSEMSAPRSDAAVLITTFVLTVLVDLTVAIEVGMVLAAFLFMRRMAEVTNISVVTREMEDDPDYDANADANAVRRRTIPRGVLVYEINGPFFFGAAEKFKETIGEISDPPRVLIVRMRNVNAIDSTGLNALKDVVRRFRKDHTRVLLTDVHAQPMVALGRSDFLEEIGEENLFGSLDDALDEARRHLEARKPSARGSKR
jgi:SulP family sulfate permease